jgi:hypothetical protein
MSSSSHQNALRHSRLKNEVLASQELPGFQVDRNGKTPNSSPLMLAIKKLEPGRGPHPGKAKWEKNSRGSSTKSPDTYSFVALNCGLCGDHREALSATKRSFTGAVCSFACCWLPTGRSFGQLSISRSGKAAAGAGEILRRWQRVKKGYPHRF